MVKSSLYKTRKKLLCWFLAAASFIYPGMLNAGTSSEVVFLNDRSADIVASIPLQAPGLVVPGGLSGQGILVGMADSGLDKGSISDLPPDLKSEPGRIPRIVMLKSYANRGVPDDPIGHGTHMAATVVGNGQASGGQFKGIAPGASLYFQALLDQNGNIKIPDNLFNLFGPAYEAGVRIHVDGWGEENNTYGNHTAQVDNFVYEHPDFLPVFGAGNDGPGKSTLSVEANSKNALVVGSSQTVRPVFSSEAVDASLVAASSSRGPTQDGRSKPDVLAPGSSIISLKSSLTAGNYEANKAYTIMAGTSMAAAVTGGALAILEEYLKSQEKISHPSSALLKALLINGARPVAGKYYSDLSGFGLLDLAGTILPLKEGGFIIAQDQKNLGQGDVLEYRYPVRDAARPFKATLAWIDAASNEASPGLVNNLDIEVIDPQGRVLMGNDFQGKSAPDRKNNVEQVVISRPQVGQYTIRVRAADIKGRVLSSHYALVYGQAFIHDVALKVDAQGNTLHLASGRTLNLGVYSLLGSLDGGQIYSTGSRITAGSDVYLNDRLLYVFGDSWSSGGIQIIQNDQGTLLAEMNPNARQGGYMLDDSSQVSLTLNGNRVDQVSGIPSGAKIQAFINPQLQTIWALNASYSIATGYVEKANWPERTIKLVQSEVSYQLAPWCAVSSQDSLLESSDVDLPYGSINSMGDEVVNPGIKVFMIISPLDKQVQYVKIERRVIVSEVMSLDTKSGEIKTQEGQTYKVFPGSKILRDGKTGSLNEINVGDKISGIILSDSNQFIELQVYSNVIYGRVVYYNPGLNQLYLFDSSNRFWNLNLDKDANIGMQGVKSGNMLVPGKWIRAVLSPDSETVWRIDIAQDKQEEVEKTFRYYDQAKNIIYMNDGSLFSYTSATKITKGGYTITPDFLSPGEHIIINTLACPGSGEVLIEAKASVMEGIDPPLLEASASNLNNVLVIRGYTTADKVKITRQDGNHEDIPVNSDGSFSRITLIQNGEESLSILAVNTKTGGIIGEILNINLPNQPVKTFIDVASNSDRASIEHLASQGIVAGFGDGTYRPELAINRADFLAMLGRAGKWQVEKPGLVQYFSDNGSIPDWALGAVYFARERGFISGYSGGMFNPNQVMTREAMVAVMANIFPGTVNEPVLSKLPYNDSKRVQPWATTSYILFYQRGWLDLFGGNYLEPDRALTRGEAARFIDRLMLNAQSSLGNN